MRRTPRMLRWTLAAACVLALPALALASSHSEAPGTAKDRLADDTDLYAWVANDAPDAVTIVGNWVPLIEPNSGPNFATFDDEVHYYINIDNVGDAHKHIRYEFTFQTTRQNDNTFLYNTGVVNSITDPTLNVRQTYTITRTDNGNETVLATGLPVAPNYVGPRSMPNYANLAAQAVQTLSDGTKVFVGPRDDPFFVDLAATFDLLTIRKPPGNQDAGVDGLAGFDVMSIVIQIPKTRLTKDGQAPSAGASNNVIGIWDTAERLQTRTINADGSVSISGPEMQVSRLGNPLVNEVVIPLGKKDLFNHSEPSNDVAQFGGYVVDPELARLLHALYGINVPPPPRNDLVAVFATGVPGLNQPANVSPGEMVRLNMAIPPTGSPKRFGVLDGDLAGFPNGRRLTDDVVDIEERVVAGVLVPGFNVAPNNQLGDGVDFNDVPYLPYFPYVALPHNPFDPDHHETAEDEAPFPGKGHGPGGHGDGHGHGDDHGRGKSAQAIGTDPKAAAAISRLAFSGANPSRASGLEFTVASSGHARLAIYDAQGRLVRTLVDQDAAAGTFRSRWDGLTNSGASAGNGVFFARFTLDGRDVDVRKVVLQ